jgi:hypothetical protein
VNRYRTPLAALAVSTAIWVYVSLPIARPEAIGAIWPALVLGSFAGYLLATDWLLLAIGRAPPPETANGKFARLLGAALLALPTTGFLVWFLLVAEDNEWMAAPLALGPALLVLPFAIPTLIKVARTPVGGASALGAADQAKAPG